MDDYLSDIFEEVYVEDGLVVMGRGLGIHRLLCKFLEKYCQDVCIDNFKTSQSMQNSIYSSSSSSSSSTNNALHSVIHSNTMNMNMNINININIKNTTTDLSSSEAAATSRRIVFCINTNGLEDNILHNLLMSEGVLPNHLPKIITNEITSQERVEMYQSGGCFIITSRILIVDMLDNKINPATILGFLIPNAHRIGEFSMEAFILRVFRDNNTTGFIKAFTEDPEQLHAGGFGKLEKTLKLLHLQKVYLWPRFQMKIKDILSTCIQPIVTEISQPLTPNMKAIQNAIFVAMKSCIAELKKALPHLEIGSTFLNLENSLFQHFDVILRHQLDVDWHKISFRTKQFITDVGNLRKLLDYLLRYDAFSFYYFLLKLRQSSTDQQTPSLWLTSEAANQIFTKAQERVYKIIPVPPILSSKHPTNTSLQHPLFPPEVLQSCKLDRTLQPILESSPKWNLLQDIIKEIKDEYTTSTVPHSNEDINTQGCHPNRVLIIVKDGLTLSQIRDFLLYGSGGSYIMDQRYRWFISQQAADIRGLFKSSANRNTKKSKFQNRPAYRPMSMAVLTEDASNECTSAGSSTAVRDSSDVPVALDELGYDFKIPFADFLKLSADNKLLLLEEQRLHKATPIQPQAKGGMGIEITNPSLQLPAPIIADENADSNLKDFFDLCGEDDNDEAAQILSSTSASTTSASRSNSTKPKQVAKNSSKSVLGKRISREGGELNDGENEEEEDADVCLTGSLLDPDFHVLMYTHAQVLSMANVMEDLRPQYVVLYDAEVSIVRAIEVFQAGISSVNTDTKPVKVYFLMYEGSAEQFRYVDSLAKEKKAFESLIMSKAHMVIALPDSTKALNTARREDIELLSDSRSINKTLTSTSHYSTHAQTSTFLPGTSSTKLKKHSTNNSTVLLTVIDVREFRCSLPSLLYGSGFTIVPRTLAVGDYVVSSEICIERKGISDLFQSFASGRLYNQAEAMGKHYKHPCLLIEFAGDKAFSLQSSSDITADISSHNIITKLSVLALTFPNLRYLWSRSAYDTSGIIKAIIQNHDPVDVSRAVSAGASLSGDDSTVGTDDSAEAEARAAACEMLASLPGINEQNCRAVQGSVRDIRELSAMTEQQLAPLIGPVNAKKLTAFFRQRVL